MHSAPKSPKNAIRFDGPCRVSGVGTALTRLLSDELYVFYTLAQVHAKKWLPYRCREEKITPNNPIQEGDTTNTVKKWRYFRFDVTTMSDDSDFFCEPHRRTLRPLAVGFTTSCRVFPTGKLFLERKMVLDRPLHGA